MKCSGTDVATGDYVEIEFDHLIREIRILPNHGSGEESEASAVWLAPGFIDIQVNGFAGVDFNNPEATTAQTGLALDTILTTGVTRCLPTVITGAPHDMLQCLRNLRRAQRELTWGRAITGFHVEGPHIGAEDGPRGAHPRRWVRPPDIAEFHRWQDATDGHIRLITLSPHWPEARGYIEAIVRAGVTASVGHTGASAEQIAAAVDAGATLSTHLGNGAHGVMRRHPNYIWDQLAEDRLSASFIVDGIHLGRAFLRTALRAKTVQRAVLVTDASAPAGAEPGRYRLGEQDADLTPDGRVVLAGTDKLAGSALQMHVGVANLMRLGGLSLRDAVQTATVNPAKIVRLDGRMQGLKAGDAADIVALRMVDGAIEIEAVYLDGEVVAAKVRG